MKIGTMRRTLLTVCMLTQMQGSSAFCPAHVRGGRAFSFAMRSTTLPEIESMRVGELKKELESYGMSTKSYFEKSELVDAVQKARSEGKTPISKSTSSSSSSTSSTSSSSSSSSSSSKQPSKSREEQIAEEMEKCASMKAGEMKKELESMGVSTKAFFEKSEFQRALAEARVDGVQKKNGSSGDDGYAEYANVEVLTDDSSGPRKRSSEGQQGGRNPFGGGGMGGDNPFTGGMGDMGGMGGMDMGSMADMLKNMGGMGGMGGGANPFGGGGGAGGNPFAGGANPFGGGNPFGGAGGVDPMKKAQELMSNPKVREIMMKAQSNPKIMKAVQECMGNPAAFMKYQNDPEVGEVLRELQKYM